MSHLPKDLIADILSLLPVTNLLQLRLVCKLWRALIDSPDFLKIHLSRSLHRHVIVRDEHLHSVGFDLLVNYRSVTPEKINHHPLSCQDDAIEVLGSCDGLLCLSDSSNTLAIWNFSTRKSRILPHAPIEFKDLSNYVDTRIYGFCYDKISDDYKVVRIVVLKDKDGNVFDNEVKVYSLKLDTWRRVEKLLECPNLEKTVGFFAGGCLHWVFSEGLFTRNGGKIVTFNIEREIFGSLDQPESTDKCFMMGLQCLDGCLSISCNYYLEHVDVWVMKDYGIKESWTKLISIKQVGFGSFFQYMHPIMYSTNGKELLFERDANKLVWYDMDTKNMRYVEIQGMRDLMQVYVCVESLIPLNDVGEAARRS